MGGRWTERPSLGERSRLAIGGAAGTGGAQAGSSSCLWRTRVGAAGATRTPQPLLHRAGLLNVLFSAVTTGQEAGYLAGRRKGGRGWGGWRRTCEGTWRFRPGGA